MLPADPCTISSAANLVPGCAAEPRIGVRAGIIASSHGSASVTPTPRRAVRLEMCFLVIYIALSRFTRFEPSRLTHGRLDRLLLDLPTPTGAG